MTVAQPAQVPLNPLPRGLMTRLLAALFMGIFGGLGIVFGIELYLVRSFTSGEHIERKLGSPRYVKFTICLTPAASALSYIAWGTSVPYFSGRRLIRNDMARSQVIRFSRAKLLPSSAARSSAVYILPVNNAESTCPLASVSAAVMGHCEGAKHSKQSPH